jgi:hypothetical protein
MEYMEIDLETLTLFVEMGLPIIVPEHQGSRAVEARARGEELRKQSEALRAQARHQVARARRNADRHNG